MTQNKNVYSDLWMIINKSIHKITINKDGSLELEAPKVTWQLPAGSFDLDLKDVELPVTVYRPE